MNAADSRYINHTRMSGFHDDRTERDYGSGGGYRSNRDVREAARYSLERVLFAPGDYGGRLWQHL